METNETKISFEAALEMALRAEIDCALAQTPSPAELKRGSTPIRRAGTRACTPP